MGGTKYEGDESPATPDQPVEPTESPVENTTIEPSGDVPNAEPVETPAE